METYILNWSASYNNVHILIVLDSCHSGLVKAVALLSSFLTYKNMHEYWYLQPHLRVVISGWPQIRLTLTISPVMVLWGLTHPHLGFALAQIWYYLVGWRYCRFLNTFFSVDPQCPIWCIVRVTLHLLLVELSAPSTIHRFLSLLLGRQALSRSAYTSAQ